MRKANYYKTSTGKNVAAIGKSGSSAISKAILTQQYPDQMPVMLGADVSNAPVWQNRVPHDDDPQDNVVIGVRDPVERFRSSCAQDGKTAEEQLQLIENGEFNFHTRPTSGFIKATGKLFKFPEHIAELATELGLVDIPSVNDSGTNNATPKPTLTKDELARVQAVYADDIALFEYITEAGKAFTAPPIPATPEEISLKIAELEEARWQAEIAGISIDLGGVEVSVYTDKETQAELSKALTILQIDPSFLINWKFPDGTIIELDGTMIQAIAQSVFAHVQSTRTRFKELNDLVLAATSFAELDIITW